MAVSGDIIGQVAFADEGGGAERNLRHVQPFLGRENGDPVVPFDTDSHRLESDDIADRVNARIDALASREGENATVKLRLVDVERGEHAIGPKQALHGRADQRSRRAFEYVNMVRADLIRADIDAGDFKKARQVRRYRA